MLHCVYSKQIFVLVIDSGDRNNFLLASRSFSVDPHAHLVQQHAEVLGYGGVVLISDSGDNFTRAASHDVKLVQVGSLLAWEIAHD